MEKIHWPLTSASRKDKLQTDHRSETISILEIETLKLVEENAGEQNVNLE